MQQQESQWLRKAAQVWTSAEFIPADSGDPEDEELLAAA
jgi:hypothetical protein